MKPIDHDRRGLKPCGGVGGAMAGLDEAEFAKHGTSGRVICEPRRSKDGNREPVHHIGEVGS